MVTRRRQSAFILCVLILGGRSIADEPLRVAGDRPVDVLHLALDLKVDIPEKAVEATAVIDLRALRDVSSIRFDAVNFDVSRVTFSRGEGSPAAIEFINDGDHVEILLGDSPLLLGESASVRIDYRLHDPSSGLHFFAPSEANPDTPYQVWSQGQSTSNRHWVPCFDHPNEMHTTEMRVTAPKGYEVISNGRLVSKKENGDGTVTFHWLQDRPHVAYLISLIVGEFHVAQETWRGKPVLYYVPEKNKDDVQRTFGNTTRMLEHFTQLTGVEYPWDKYAQTCAEGFGGGMENTSATTLGTWVLHDERAHLDYSADGLIAHELAHQWFGDFVTCQDWSHLWLNEGFASFMTPIWYEFDLGKEEYDYSIFGKMQRAVDGGKDKPVVDRHYGSPGEMFDSRSYPKGSIILHMLRRRVGDKMFWRCVNRYLVENAHQPVETSVFRRTFERITGRSLERFFYDWTERPGAPAVEVQFDWNEEDRLAELVFKQTQEADAFYFPLELEFHFDGLEPKVIKRQVTEKVHHFLFSLPKHPAMVLIDPRDAVLMELKEKKGRDLWSKQLAHSPYVISRIRAARHLGESGKEAEVKLLAAALARETFWGVGEQIAEALGEAGGDAARDALLAGLKHAHPKVRRTCTDELGAFHKDEVVINALYSLIQTGDPSYRVEAAAIRSYGELQPDDALTFLATLMDRESHRDQIRGAVLGAIGDLDVPTGLAILLEWSQRGKQRFTRMAALSAMGDLAENAELSDEDMEKTVQALADSIKGENRWLQRTVIRSLSDLGESARSALPKLRAVAAHDPSDRTRDAADKAIEKIQEASPAPAQVDDLREELKQLREENEAFKARLDKLEALSETSGS